MATLFQQKLEQTPITQWNEILPSLSPINREIVNWRLVNETRKNAKANRFNQYLEMGYSTREASDLTDFGKICC